MSSVQEGCERGVIPLCDLPEGHVGSSQMQQLLPSIGFINARKGPMSVAMQQLQGGEDDRNHQKEKDTRGAVSYILQRQ